MNQAPGNVTKTTAAQGSADNNPYVAFAQLAEGDRVQILHEIKIGLKIWQTTTLGTVERLDRRRHGLHFRRNHDDKVFSDIIVLKRADGELTTVTVDEFTQISKLA